MEKIARYLKSKRYAKICGAVAQIAGEIVKLVMEYKPARRYGLPCLESYSTVCLRYGAKLQELKNRKTTRPSYSFNDHKDNIPSIWA
ncbi:hypothetical protein Pisl_0337 [Pyrobaculum islandicum DSM 4184]|uniref:Uncharacterized protein n=1 Tax=Pyrobaculum islandicum (strain DSM 4184 / JCM 9189 / GEO3) TaxID=384616 RepID=A1RRD3_PYRIL|nr:hypothetical protein [Pyrobaculum islandicum]ABL87515.1 hypothetical protein Pisl_0337 [Pyrobaculum islandicum DSM 4184]